MYVVILHCCINGSLLDNISEHLIYLGDHSSSGYNFLRFFVVVVLMAVLYSLLCLSRVLYVDSATVNILVINHGLVYL